MIFNFALLFDCPHLWTEGERGFTLFRLFYPHVLNDFENRKVNLIEQRKINRTTVISLSKKTGWYFLRFTPRKDVLKSCTVRGLQIHQIHKTSNSLLKILTNTISSVLCPGHWLFQFHSGQRSFNNLQTHSVLIPSLLFDPITMMAFNWEGKKELLYDLYITQNKSIEEVMEYFRVTESFTSRYVLNLIIELRLPIWW